MRTQKELQKAARSGDECWTETLSARADVRGRKNGVCAVGPMGGEGGRRVRRAPHRKATPKSGRAGDHKRRTVRRRLACGTRPPCAAGTRSSSQLGARGCGNDTRVTCTQLSIHAWTAPLRASRGTASSCELRNCAPPSRFPSAPTVRCHLFSPPCAVSRTPPELPGPQPPDRYHPPQSSISFCKLPSFPAARFHTFPSCMLPTSINSSPLQTALRLFLLSRNPHPVPPHYSTQRFALAF